MCGSTLRLNLCYCMGGAFINLLSMTPFLLEFLHRAALASSLNIAAQAVRLRTGCSETRTLHTPPRHRFHRSVSMPGWSIVHLCLIYVWSMLGLWPVFGSPATDLFLHRSSASLAQLRGFLLQLQDVSPFLPPSLLGGRIESKLT